MFCPVCKARNNEEYREVLKKRQFKMYGFISAGFLTEAVSLYAYFCTQIQLSDYRLGFLMGLGFGLAFGGVAALLRIRGRLKDEEKLKEFRLKETDEREIEINGLALRGTARLLLGALYLMLILGGLLGDDKVLNISWVLLAVFLLGNVLLRRHYASKL